jgi:hypothetical protein
VENGKDKVERGVGRLYNSKFTSTTDTSDTSNPDTTNTSNPDTSDTSNPDTSDTSNPHTSDTSNPDTSDTSNSDPSSGAVDTQGTAGVTGAGQREQHAQQHAPYQEVRFNDSIASIPTNAQGGSGELGAKSGSSGISAGSSEDKRQRQQDEPSRGRAHDQGTSNSALGSSVIAGKPRAEQGAPHQDTQFDDSGHPQSSGQGVSTTASKTGNGGSGWGDEAVLQSDHQDGQIGHGSTQVVPSVGDKDNLPSNAPPPPPRGDNSEMDSPGAYSSAGDQRDAGKYENPRTIPGTMQKT